MNASVLTVRRATLDDVPTAIAVAGRALGWNPAEPNEALFRWKHLDNPAGVSPMWLALDGDDVAGFRTMLRWRFRDDAGGVVAAVRAVDTATHPDHQRRGVFRSLTTRAVDELVDDGVAFVFNTPNAQSRPGYLRMGWCDAGRLATRVAISGPASLARMLRARTAAHKWSEPVSAGTTIDRVVDELPDRLAAQPPVAGLRTDRSVEHLRWRYGFEPLHYRVVRDDHALAVVRVRRRGAAREAVLAELIASRATAARPLLRRIRRELAIDHVLTLSRAPQPAPWWPTIPHLGPHLALRDLASPAPTPDRLRLSLGDVELF